MHQNHNDNPNIQNSNQQVAMSFLLTLRYSAQEEVKRIQSVPLTIGQFLEMIDKHGIIGSTTRIKILILFDIDTYEHGSMNNNERNKNQVTSPTANTNTRTITNTNVRTPVSNTQNMTKAMKIAAETNPTDENHLGSYDSVDIDHNAVETMSKIHSSGGGGGSGSGLTDKLMSIYIDERDLDNISMIKEQSVIGSYFDGSVTGVTGVNIDFAALPKTEPGRNEDNYNYNILNNSSKKPIHSFQDSLRNITTPMNGHVTTASTNNIETISDTSMAALRSKSKSRSWYTDADSKQKEGKEGNSKCKSNSKSKNKDKNKTKKHQIKVNMDTTGGGGDNDNKASDLKQATLTMSPLETSLKQLHYQLSAESSNNVIPNISFSNIDNTTNDANYYARVLSTLNKEDLKPPASVALHRHAHSVVDILPPEVDSTVNQLAMSKKHEDIDGLNEQKQQIRKAVELPLAHFHLYQQIGLDQPPVADNTEANFIRVVGSEFAQKYSGEAARMVQNVFRLARENVVKVKEVKELKK